jgi:hypothetical protein
MMMIKKLHIKFHFIWFDFWMGVYIDLENKTVFICPLPMLPIKIWWTEHLKCPTCGRPMQKTAFDTGDGWALQWYCSECQNDEENMIDWPFGDRGMSASDLRKAGYVID